MLDIELLKSLNEDFANKRIDFTPLDREFNAGKNYRLGKLHGLFSRGYRKRDELFSFGEIIYALTFKSFINEFSQDKNFPSWVIFSPSKDLQNNPRFYYDIATKLEEVTLKKKPNKIEKRLQQILLSNVEEPNYLEIPEPYNLGYLAYISICYVRPPHIANFKPGINLILMARKTTDEVMYLPDRYWSEEYKDEYFNKNKVIEEDVNLENEENTLEDTKID